jgi:hypothetical protein
VRGVVVVFCGHLHTAPALATHSTVRDPTLTLCVFDAQDESRRAALVSALVLAGCVDVEVTAGRVSGRKPAWEVRKQHIERDARGR